jgi:hypothetical protein
MRELACGSPPGVQTARDDVLASIWRPNHTTASLLFSVVGVRKLLIFLAWGARGPEFKSRQPDQIPQTDLPEVLFWSLCESKRHAGALGVSFVPRSRLRFSAYTKSVFSGQNSPEPLFLLQPGKSSQVTLGFSEYSQYQKSSRCLRGPVWLSLESGIALQRRKIRE